MWAFAVVGLFSLLVWACPPFRGAALFAAGRASTCSLVAAMRSPGATAALIAAMKRVRETSRRAVSGDGRFEMWETEQGPFWILKDPGPAALFIVLPEQAIGIHDGNGLGVRSGDVVLDCGAHYGVYTRHALKAGARLVVAIEPHPDNVECLRRTFEAEIEQGRVVLCAKGVWDRDDWLPLHVDPNMAVGHSFVLQRESAEVLKNLPLTTIDKIVSELRLPRIDFIKMDIEGAERRALAGGRATLARFQPRMVVTVYHLADDAVTIPRIVTSINPAYRVRCGFCIDWGHYIRHEVTHFY